MFGQIIWTQTLCVSCVWFAGPSGNDASWTWVVPTKILNMTVSVFFQGLCSVVCKTCQRQFGENYPNIQGFKGIRRQLLTSDSEEFVTLGKPGIRKWSEARPQSKLMMMIISRFFISSYIWTIQGKGNQRRTADKSFQVNPGVRYVLTEK